MTDTTESLDFDPRDESLRQLIVDTLGPEDHRLSTDPEIEAMLDSCGELRMTDEQMELILRRAESEIAAILADVGGEEGHGEGRRGDEGLDPSSLIPDPSSLIPPPSKSPVLGFLGDLMGSDGWPNSTTLFSGYVIAALTAATLTLAIAVAFMVRGVHVTVDHPQVARQIPVSPSPPLPFSPSTPKASSSPVPESFPAPSFAVARVAQLVDCRWADSLKAPADGDKLSVGRLLEMRAGVAEIDFDIGARLILQGPAALKLLSSKSARLDLGKATVEIHSQRARGFKIVTAETTFIDQGTEFGVEVPPGGGSKVHVFKGKVDVDHATAGKNGPDVTQRLPERIGSRMEAGQKGMTLVEDTGECFIRSMDEAQRNRHTVAWWRFEDRPIGQLLPESAENSRSVCATVDSSFNGNDLYAWDRHQQPAISADVSAAVVSAPNVSNRSCLDNSDPGVGFVHRNLYTHSLFSHTAPLDVQKIAPAEWTIEASVKAAAMPAKAQPFLVRDGSYSLEAERRPPRLVFQINESGRFAVSFYDAADRSHAAVADGPATEAGRWYHLAATSDGRQLRLYVDALDGRGYVLRAATDLPAAGSTALGKGPDDAEWAIGRGDNVKLPQQQFIGWIDEVRISDIARQPAEFLFAPLREAKKK